MKKALFAIVTLSVAFTACKKKDEPSEVTKTQMLTQGKWKITEVYIEKDNVVALDYYSTMEECEKDNLFTFNADYTITSDEGPTKCDPSVQQTTTDGKWALTNGEKDFTIKESSILPLSGDQSMTIAALDNSIFKLSKDTTIVYPGVGTLSGTIRATFKKN